jgi:ribonucleoside-diphosphate reductase beta chain
MPAAHRPNPLEIEIEMIEGKRIIGGDPSLFNLAPFQYIWAWDATLKSLANHWTPFQVQMSKDVEQWKNKALSPVEAEMFTTVLAVLTTQDLAVARNIAVALYEKVSAPEVQLLLGRQLAEEGIHSLSYQHIIECLGLDQQEIYGVYRKVPEISQKFDLIRRHTDWLTRYGDSPQQFLKGLTFFYVCVEGGYFPCSFAALLGLARRNLMSGTGEQISYILRDELAGHFPFGVKLITTIQEETGYYLSRADVVSIIREALDAEAIYARHAIPSILGYSPDLHIEHFKWLMDTALDKLGFEPEFGARCALPWLSEMMELKRETNFFEKHNQEYQSGVKLEFESSGLDDVVNWKQLPTAPAL